jgi:isoprene-epoxide---glutathione S-transferase
MITLYGHIPAWGLVDMSPYVHKIDCYMRMVGLEHELVPLPDGDLTKTPKGKLPVIDDDGTIVADTSFILEYLKEKYGDTLDGHLTAQERAIAFTFWRMMDESFYWYLIQMRYRRDEDFALYDPFWAIFLSFVPPEERAEPVRAFRENILNEFFYAGRGRHTTEDVEHMAFREYDAVAAQLGDKPYMMGDQPSSVDAAVYAFLIHAMRVPFESPIKDYGNSIPILVAYLDRIYTRYYPELAQEVTNVG